MRPYRILRSTDGGEGASERPDESATIARDELEALRARAEAATRREPFGDEPAGSPGAGPPRRDVAAEEAAADRERRLAEMERAYREALRDRELATALAGRPLVPGGAAQLMKLWRDEFEVFEDGGRFQVASRDGRPVEQVVAERLASGDYAHFSPPSSRGGAAPRSPSRPSAATAQSAPRTLGELIVQRWRDEAATRPGPAPGAIGLGRRR